SGRLAAGSRGRDSQSGKSRPEPRQPAARSVERRAGPTLPNTIDDMSSTEHRRTAPASVSVHVITISDTRTPESDASGNATAEMLTAGGHTMHGRSLLKDEPELVRDAIALLARNGVDAIVTPGGTGITSRDGTFEAIDALLTKRLPGFGELFRMLSY